MAIVAVNGADIDFDIDVLFVDGVDIVGVGDAGIDIYFAVAVGVSEVEVDFGDGDGDFGNVDGDVSDGNGDGDADIADGAVVDAAVMTGFSHLVTILEYQGTQTVVLLESCSDCGTALETELSACLYPSCISGSFTYFLLWG